ncbi:MAG: ABC transporter permease [Spirosomataceae bacterium]
MIRNYLKIAFRNLFKNKIYTFINVFGLALGISTTALLALWIQNELSYDSFHAKSKNIYRINTHLKINDTDTWHWASTPLKLSDYFKENAPEVLQSTRLNVPYGEFFSVKIDNNVIGEKSFAFVDKNWFDVFDYTFISGNAKDFGSDKYNIAITQSKARQYFGDANPIGKIVSRDSINFVVKAVLADNPSNSSFKFDVLAQNEARLANPKVLENDSNWNNFNYTTFIVCSDGVNIKKTSDKFTKLLAKLREDKENNTSLEIQPITAIHFDNVMQSEWLAATGDKSTLYIFAIVAAFILLIACINYVNLTTARASQRGKEVSIKKMIGASNGSLFNQFFIESVITSIFAAAISVLLIIYGLPILDNLADNQFSLSNPIIWVILAVITVLSIVLTGIYPSILLSAFEPIKILKGTNIGGAKNATFRKSLVVVQFTFTIVILISTLLIFKQLKFIQDKNLGYDKENIYTLTIPWNIKNNKAVHQTLMQKLQAESSIQDVTASSMSIIDMQSTHSGSLNWDGKKPDWQPTVNQMSVVSDFNEFFKLKITDGRWFDEANAGDDNHVILNETAIKEFNIKKAVGQRFEFHGRKGQIIGVVKDFHFKSPREKITPLVIFRNNNWQSTIYIKTAPNQFRNAIATTEKLWKELIPDLAFKYSFLDDSYAKLHEKEAKQSLMFNAFTSIVLLISCFGLFGLATFSAEQRTKEIGIRKVLGASVANIASLLSQEFMKLVLVAIVLASPIAYYFMKQWLESFAYKISIEWSVFALAGVLALLIAFLTVSYQAIKAALANPVNSLKTE